MPALVAELAPPPAQHDLAALALSEPAAPLVLVPPEVSSAKLERELAAWAEQEDGYLRRGWRLRRVGELEVEVLFLAAVAVDPASRLTVVAPCVRFRFDNYDIVAPSVEFVDSLTGEPAHPGVNAFLPTPDGQPRNVLVHPHPRTGRPFLCLPGVREYHEHPQHNGDDWLLHRGSDAGRLAVLCERIWRAIPRTLIGVGIQTRWTPPVSELRVQLLQGDPEQLRAISAQMEAVSGEGPGLAEQGLMLAAPQPASAQPQAAEGVQP